MPLLHAYVWRAISALLKRLLSEHQQGALNSASRWQTGIVLSASILYLPLAQGQDEACQSESENGRNGSDKLKLAVPRVTGECNLITHIPISETITRNGRPA